MANTQGIARKNDLDEVNNNICDGLSTTVFADTLLVALKNSVMGTQATDSKDDGATIIQGSATVFADNLPVAFNTAVDSAGYKIVSASQTVFVDGTVNS